MQDEKTAAMKPFSFRYVGLFTAADRMGQLRSNTSFCATTTAANVTNLYRLNKRKNWYYSSLTKSIIKVLHVVVAHVDMQTDIIPRGYSYNDIKDTYMGKMSDVCHEFILDEINRRDRLNYEEERMVFSDESDDESV